MTGWFKRKRPPRTATSTAGTTFLGGETRSGRCADGRPVSGSGFERAICLYPEGPEDNVCGGGLNLTAGGLVRTHAVRKAKKADA